MQGVLNSLDDTRYLAEVLASFIERGETLALVGNLGAGKTTFVAEFAKALGSTVPASSPTFVLCQEYPAAYGLKIEHWDVYRLKESPEELEEVVPPDTVRIIEWADKFPELLERAVFKLSLDLREEGSRLFTLSSAKPLGMLAEALKAAGIAS